MAFRFKFDQLLRLAVHNETEVKTRLAIKEGQIAEIDSMIANLESEYANGVEEKVQDLLAGRMERVRMYAVYFQRLLNTKEFHREERVRLVSQRDKILAELMEKRRVRKTYEKIREREEKKFVKKEQARDQKRMDDFATRLNPPQVEETADD